MGGVSGLFGGVGRRGRLIVYVVVALGVADEDDFGRHFCGVVMGLTSFDGVGAVGLASKWLTGCGGGAVGRAHLRDGGSCWRLVIFFILSMIYIHVGYRV